MQKKKKKRKKERKKRQKEKTIRTTKFILSYERPSTYNDK